jgi:hypothetical protein
MKKIVKKNKKSNKQKKAKNKNVKGIIIKSNENNKKEEEDNEEKNKKDKEEEKNINQKTMEEKNISIKIIKEEDKKKLILKNYLLCNEENKLINLYKLFIENPLKFKEKKLLDIVIYLNELEKHFNILNYLKKYPKVFECLFGKNDENKFITKLERKWEYKINKVFNKKVSLNDLNKIEKEMYCLIIDLINGINGIFEDKCEEKNVNNNELLEVREKV